MITVKDVACIEKLAPVAQLLEMLGTFEQGSVRSPDVFSAMARDVWRIYWYLGARFNDEMFGGMYDPPDDVYYHEVRNRVERAVDEM